MVLDRHRLEAAATNGSLGLLADEAVIAAIHYLAQVPLDERDQRALERAQHILEAVVQFDNRRLVTGSVLRTMAPLNALDETFDAVSTATESGDFTERVGRYIGIVRAMLAGNADPREAREIRALFERLAQVTLIRSEDMIRPSREERHEWIRTAFSL